jgi:hypothetical protein
MHDAIISCKWCILIALNIMSLGDRWPGRTRFDFACGAQAHHVHFVAAEHSHANLRAGRSPWKVCAWLLAFPATTRSNCPTF